MNVSMSQSFRDMGMAPLGQTLPYGNQEPICLIHPAGWNNRGMSEIDWSHTRHVTVETFGDITKDQWRHNEPIQLVELFIH